MAVNILSKLFPNMISTKNDVEDYVPGSLERFIKTKINKSKLSKGDINALLDLISEFSDTIYLENKQKILATKEVIEKYYIEDVINEFEKLIKQKKKTKRLEEKWQKFFEDHTWLLSQIFSAPIIYYKSQAYIGGKTIGNIGGKITDFLYKNKLTKNVAIIEIKTHLTILLENRPYRGSDVFPMSRELSGGIAQVLDQRDNLIKNYYSLSATSKEDFEVNNPQCVLIIGMSESLSEEQKKSFELIRNIIKDVEIITFDELFYKIKGLQKLITGKL